jgi:hypothetical protein
MRTEMVFETLVYSPFIYIYIYIYITVVCFFPSLHKKLSQLHACLGIYSEHLPQGIHDSHLPGWESNPNCHRYAAGIAIFEYGLALPINHSSLDHKKLDVTEFVVLCMFTILWLHFLFVKIQSFFLNRWCILTQGHQLSLITFQETPQILLFITCQKSVKSYEGIHDIA